MRGQLAGGLLALAGIVHLLLAPEHLEEAPGLGLAFLAGGVLALGWALVVARRPGPAVWGAGMVIALAMGLAYLASRTVGLAGMHEAWDENVQAAVAAGIAELGVVLLAVPALAQARR